LKLDPLLTERLTAYMRGSHIPGIYQTGCFRRISFQRAAATRFRTSYQAASSTDLERYLTVHAEAFRADFRSPLSIRDHDKPGDLDRGHRLGLSR
jgi:hypothetical protein